MDTVWLLSSNMNQQLLMWNSPIKIHFFHQVLMAVWMHMMLLSTKSSENSNQTCNANLHVWKLINQKILSLLVHLILMRFFHGMYKLEIFCKSLEVIHHQFHLSKWLGKSLSQDLGIRRLKFTKFFLESWMLKHYNTVHKSQLLLSIQAKNNVQQLQWKVKFTFGMLRQEV